jgi:hypothetical protein
MVACSATPSEPSAAAESSAELLAERGHHHERAIKHVLLISVDGMHQLDLTNFIAANPDSALAGLVARGVQFTNAYVNDLSGSATNPSDSFPGLLALTTGGSSRTHGGWYDVSYARDLYPYNASAPCSGTPGTAVVYDESIELDADDGFPSLWGSTSDDTPTHEPAVVRTRLDPTKLPYRKHGKACTPVLPHEFIRSNTIFEVAHAAGLHTAWSDKHPAYELVTGPSGRGLDDFFAPEINSVATNLVPAAGPDEDYTTKPSSTEIYDDYKVAAILKQIDGKWSDDGLAGVTDTSGPAPGVPAIFGMNFQAVSVAQKNARTPDGGYLDAAGTAGAELAHALAHTDASIGRMVDELKAQKRFADTLIIVTAKHGQSPIDKSLVRKVDGDAVAALIDAVAPLAGHIEDDVALYWLKDPNTAPAAVAALLQPGTLDPSIDTVYSAASAHFRGMFGDPRRDSHTPDLVVKLKKGTIYSLSTKKNAEHGGFADDDSHVALIVSNPALEPCSVSQTVRTKQVAATVLAALGLDLFKLDAVRAEGTMPLPKLDL